MGLLYECVIVIVAGMFSFIYARDMVNAALGKSAGQSSTKYDYVADRAVDGDISTRTRTRNSRSFEPFWFVDLGSVFEIHAVTVFNYVSESDSLKELELQIGVTESDYMVAGFHPGIIDHNYTYTLNSTCGRWVKLTIRTNSTLNLAEVVVLGYPTYSKFTFAMTPSAQGRGSIISHRIAGTPTQCCFQCSKSGSCFGVDYNTITNNCTLFASNEVETTNNGDIMHWSLLSHCQN